MNKQNDLWVVFDYEVSMFQGLISVNVQQVATSLPLCVQNALAESLLLHARILIDILLSRGKNSDDITLRKLLPDFTSPKIASLKNLYGNSKTPNTPCWTLNKKLAHASHLRSESHDYTALVQKLAPTILHLVGQVNGARPSG